MIGARMIIETGRGRTGKGLCHTFPAYGLQQELKGCFCNTLQFKKLSTTLLSSIPLIQAV
jgi:hypothetical protein